MRELVDSCLIFLIRFTLLDSFSVVVVFDLLKTVIRGAHYSIDMLLAGNYSTQTTNVLVVVLVIKSHTVPLLDFIRFGPKPLDVCGNVGSLEDEF